VGQGSEFVSAVRRELEAVIQQLDGPKKKPPNPDQRLIHRAHRKRRSLRNHTQSFLSTNLFIFLLWLTIALTTGAWFPWFMFPLLGWGLGYTMHVLGYRSWVSDHRQELAAAEQRLGLAAPAFSGDLWSQLVERCRATVEESRQLLGPQSLPAPLEASLTQVEALSEAARRIESVLAQMLPSGEQGLKQQIAEAEMAWQSAIDPDLKTVHAQNRSLLQTRLSKVESLAADRDRIAATLEGFILAAENLRLDAIRHQQGDLDAAALLEPVQRIQDEVEVLEKVQAELASLSVRPVAGDRESS
jgi:hypothetical protein